MLFPLFVVRHEVVDVAAEVGGGIGAVGQVAEDDGDDAGGVVDDLGIVLEVALLAGMDAIVVGGLQQLGAHAHELLPGCAEQVVAPQELLLHEGEREVVVEEYFHLVVLLILMAQVGGVCDVEAQRGAVVAEGVSVAQLDVQAVVGGDDVVEGLELLAVGTGSSQEQQ